MLSDNDARQLFSHPGIKISQLINRLYIVLGKFYDTVRGG
jgi:hypothetical protein